MKKNHCIVSVVILVSIILSFDIFSQNISHQLHQRINFKNPKLIKLSVLSFEIKKLKPVKFQSFTLNDFNLKKNEIVKLKNGKSISSEKFLFEVNEIEKKLNDLGYSLRNNENEIVLAKFIYPYEQLQKQKNLFSHTTKKYLKENLKVTPCGLLNEDEIKTAIKSGVPKEPWPITQNRKWSVEFGNENFGAEINSEFYFTAEDRIASMKINSDSEIDIRINLLGENIPALKLLDRTFNYPSQNNIILFLFNNKAIEDNLSSASIKNYFKELNWESGFELSIGQFNLNGNLKTTGKAGLTKVFNPEKLKFKEELKPYLDLDFSGELNSDFEIVEAGVQGKLKLLNDTLSLKRTIELKNPGAESFFNYNAEANNNLVSALKGKIYAYLKVDYLIGSKKFIIVFYDDESGISAEQNLFNQKIIQPSKRDRELWLEIKRINGITNYSARNEKTDVLPKSFIVEVEAAGQSFCDTLADWNKDGVIESPIQFKLPLLSSLSIPIRIQVREKYKIGDMNAESELDLSKGDEKAIQFCYNPVTRKIFGDASGDEDKEIILTGNTNYFGERNHSIRFKLSSGMQFKSAPSKVK